MGEEAVNKVADAKVINRLSPLQRQILGIMRARKAYPCGDMIGHLPRTGDILDALGRQRDASGYASVSRALSRMAKAGLVVMYQGEVARQGRAYSYALTEAAGE